MKDELEDIMRRALTPTEEPSFWLNKKIISQVKEQKKVKKSFIRRAPVMVVLIIIIMASLSFTVYAAWRHLSAIELANKSGNNELYKELQSPSAILCNETQSYGKYNVTLLGIFSKDDLQKVKEFDSLCYTKGHTYCIVAVERTDGTSMSEVMKAECKEDGLWLPVNVQLMIKIKGINDENLQRCIAGNVRRGMQIQEIDGVLYYIYSCENLEIFAKHGVYLAVADREYVGSVYKYSKKTGEITRDPAYEGTNALFELPLDKSKADEAAAEEKIQKWMSSRELDK